MPAEIWQRLVGLFVLYSLYCIIWVVAILCVSMFSRSNQQSLWTLLCAWLLLIVLIPRVIPVIAEVAYPTPNRAAFDAALAATLEQLGDSHNPNDPHFAQFRENVLREYQVGTVEELPINWRGLLMAEGERLTSVAFQTHYNHLHQQFARQDALRNRLAWLSPCAIAAILSSRLAGTDAAAVYEFERQAEVFRYDLIQKLNHHHTHDIGYENDRQQKLNRQSWLDFSSFKFKALPLANSFREGGILFLGLLPWLVVMIYLGTRDGVKRRLI